MTTDFMNLIRQFLAAALSVENFRAGGVYYQVPSYIIGNLTLANATIGDRLLPQEPCPSAPPYGLCACCTAVSTSTCAPQTPPSVCSSAPGCTVLTGLSDLTNVLGTW